MDLKKLIIVVLILSAVALIVYLIFFRKGPKQVPATNQTPAPPATQKPVDTGITVASTVSGWVKSQSNPKGEPYEQYFLTYSDGDTIIEEISKSAYDLFMKEYPSGQASGNQLDQFKNVMTR